MLAKGGRPTTAAIHRGALRANFAEAERRAGGRAVIAVVKADAYGHGAVVASRVFLEAGCRRFAVATVDEASALRSAGLAAEILVLGGVHDEAEAEEAIARGVVPVAHHEGHLELLGRVAGRREARVPVHVEVDTGMRRMGAPPDAAVALLERAAAEPGLALTGVYTHFATADEPDLGPALEQAAAFRRVLAGARARGIDPGLVHAANSAGLLAGPALSDALPEAAAVRPGLLLYGVLPAEHQRADLRPAMTLRTHVAHVRDARPGESVGYNRTFRASRRTRIATLPLGYADGVPVSASGRGSVLVRGRRFRIAGRVSMDFVGVDVGDEPVAIGDEAILFGEGGGEGSDPRISVEEAARAAGTISYELLVRVGARVPRVLEG